MGFVTLDDRKIRISGLLSGHTYTTPVLPVRNHLTKLGQGRNS